MGVFLQPLWMAQEVPLVIITVLLAHLQPSQRQQQVLPQLVQMPAEVAACMPARPLAGLQEEDVQCCAGS